MSAIARNSFFRARQTIIDRYDLKRICLPQHLAYIDELAGQVTI